MTKQPIGLRLLQERMDAVEEVRLGDSLKLTLLRGLLKGLPDLARGLCSIQYGRVSGVPPVQAPGSIDMLNQSTPKELATFVTAMHRVAATFPNFSAPADVDCSSILWRKTLFVLPALKTPMDTILASINLHRARDNNKTNMWTDPEKFPTLDNVQLSIMAVESDLAEELKRS
jgi:DNA mismatch repair protein MSH3